MRSHLRIHRSSLPEPAGNPATLEHIAPRTDFLTVGLLAPVALALLILLARTNADPDLWGHLRFGLDILSSGRIVQVDPYSYLSAGQRWINHEWLTEVIFALGWLGGREAGLIFLKTIIGATTFGLLYWHLRNQHLSPMRAAILLLVFSAALLPFMQNLRPQIFTYLLFTILLVLIFTAESGAYGWLWAIPPLMALWANLHGGFLAGVGILLAWTVVHLIQHREAWRKVLPPVLLALLALNLNPYGKDLLLFLLRTATIPRPEIEDWQPVELLSSYGVVYLAILTLSAASILLSRRRKNPALLVVFLATAFLPLLAIRHLPLFCIAALMVAAEHAEDSWSRFAPERARDRRASALLIALPVLALGTLVTLAISLQIGRIHVKEGEYPVQAVTLLRSSGLAGNLANEFNWGEYLIWHLGPQIKVSVDGRRETVYSSQIYKENADFMDGTRDWDALLKNHRTDFALVMREHTTYNLLQQDPEWLIVYQNDTSALFASKRSPALNSLRQAAASFDPPANTDRFP